MDWREYQEVVGQIYEQADGIGRVRRSLTMPDKLTGQPRQIDTLIELDAKGHNIKIVVDAKFHRDRVDVKTVEEVSALAGAVGANKAVIVCSNGWTEPAEKRANFSEMDLRLLTMEQAVEFLEPGKWKICPFCETDCIIMDHEGAVELDGVVLWWLAGQCRACRAGLAWCQDCGEKMLIASGKSYACYCYCGHRWTALKRGMTLRLRGGAKALDI